jgi:hypothetical protein
MRSFFNSVKRDCLKLIWLSLPGFITILCWLKKKQCLLNRNILY